MLNEETGRKRRNGNGDEVNGEVTIKQQSKAIKVRGCSPSQDAACERNAGTSNKLEHHGRVQRVPYSTINGSEKKDASNDDEGEDESAEQVRRHSFFAAQPRPWVVSPQNKRSVQLSSVQFSSTTMTKDAHGVPSISDRCGGAQNEQRRRTSKDSKSILRC